MQTVINYGRTLFLIAMMTGLFLAMGAVMGGTTGLAIAFIAALAMNAFALFRSSYVVLKMHKAEEVKSGDFFDLVQQLSQRAELPMPRVFIMQSPQPNAFATGASPRSAAVCASSALLEMLSPEEVAGVMAHELAHVKNRDTLTMSVAATIGGAISMLAQYLQFAPLFGRRIGGPFGWLGTLLAALVAPVAATMIQMGISRSREYEADRVGARICGNPLWLASALAKIQAAVRRGVAMPSAQTFRESAHQFVINPLTGRGMDSLFSTHPATENRIAELHKLAEEMAIEQARAGKTTPSIANAPAPWLKRG